VTSSIALKDSKPPPLVFFVNNICTVRIAVARWIYIYIYIYVVFPFEF